MAFFGVTYQVSRMAFGTPTEDVEHHQLPLSCRLSLILGAIPVLLLGGYWPQPLNDLLQLAAQSLEVLP